MYRTIVILGHWYSGTTLLSGLLGNIPGVGAPGELQWILDDPRTECSVHGAHCAFVKEVSRPGLTAANLYSRAATALGCSTLVTSDKMPRTIRRFVAPEEASALIVFKRPEALAASLNRHGNRDTAESAYEHWYPRAIQWASEYCLDTTFVEYEELAQRPQLEVDRLARQLELPAPRVLVYPPAGEHTHNIRGNLEALRSQRYGGQAIRLDNRWEKELTDREKARIQSSVGIQSTWETLKELAR